jgi:DtxR family Mn-dependent transcriptional regulator
MYLKTIAELSDGSSPIVIARVAERLGISPVSANEMMKRLVVQGHITHEPYKGVKLTKNGRYIAHSVMRRQRLWEVFLIEHLKFNWAGIHEAACRLEHATSKVLAESLAAYLDHPTVCPHGNPIPMADGCLPIVDSRPLNTLKVSETARILSIHPTQTDIFAYLNKRNIMPEQVITVIEIAPMQGPITVRLDNAEVSLGLAMAGLIMVGPLQTAALPE